MLPNPIPADLLSDEIVDLATRQGAHHDIVEPMRGVAQFDEVCEVSAWCREWDRDGLSDAGMSAGLLHGFANPLRQSSMPLTSLGSGDLERDGEELLVITHCSAAQHGKDLSCIGHGLRTALQLGSTLADTIPAMNADLNAGFARVPHSAHF